MILFYRLLTYVILFSSIRMLVGGYASLYLINHGLSISDISFLKALQGLVIVLIQVPIGFVIDRRANRYPFFLLSIFLTVIWLFLTGVSSDAFSFYTAELFNAFALAIFNAVMLPILVETYTHETGKNDYNYTLGKFFKYQNLLMAGSVILGSVFVDVGSRYLWIISAALLLALGVFSILTNDVKKFRLSTVTANEKAKFYFLQLFTQLKSNALGTLFVSNILLITIFQVLAQFWQVVIYDALGRGVSYALVYGLIFSVILILQALGSHCAEKKDSLHLSLLSIFLLVITITYLTIFNKYQSNSIVFIGLFLISFMLFKYPSVIISALLHRNIGNEIRATFDSIIGTFSIITSVVVFYLVGILVDRLGNHVMLLSIEVLSILSFISVALYLLQIKQQSKGKLIAA